MSTLINKLEIRVYFCRNAVAGRELPPELAKLELQDDVILESVPCGGRIDPRYILKAFESGAQSVCILTCPAGECKLMEGNLRAERRVLAVQELLAEAGINPQSLQIFMPKDSSEQSLKITLDKISRFVSEKCESACGMVA